MDRPASSPKASDEGPCDDGDSEALGSQRADNKELENSLADLQKQISRQQAGQQKGAIASSGGGWSLAGAGMELGIATVVFSLGGYWLDGKWGTGPWLTLVGLAVGMTAGTYNLYKAGKRYFNDASKTK